MQRIAVVGNSGSGKTSLAAALADRLEIPHLELDRSFISPAGGRWTPTSSVTGSGDGPRPTDG